jgi:hypothetical protein
MARRRQVAPSAVAADLATLVGLETDVLRLRWTEIFGAAPLRRVSRELLIRGIAFRLQEEAEGGLARKTLRQLDRLEKEFVSSGTVRIDSARNLQSGTRIVREWQGRVHEVIVLDDGYLWGGRRYRSLSEIARLITGTRWSGPRFFGTLARKNKAAEDHPTSSVVVRPTDAASAHRVDGHTDVPGVADG